MKQEAEKRNEVLERTQLERRKNVYKAIGAYILSLKGSVDIANDKEKKKLVKEVKKLAKIQEYFYKPEIEKVNK